MRPSDQIRLVFPHPDPGQPARVRWWRITQPRPSFAFSIQGRLAAALGETARHVLELLFSDETQAADFEANKQHLGEALALQTLRRSRAGKALFQPGDLVSCTERLWAVLRVATAKAGGALDHATLFGVPERMPRSPEVRWKQASILHTLLFASELRFDGEGVDGCQPRPMPTTRPTAPSHSGGDPVEYAAAYRVYEEDTARIELQETITAGSVTDFVTRLDAVVASPDELWLLSTWAALHLWRPF